MLMQRLCAPWSWLLALLMCAAAGADDRGPTLAILVRPGPAEAVAAAVEARLAARGTRLVERQHIDAALAEQAIAARFGDADGAGRVELGRVLGADVLVMLDAVAGPTPHLRVTAAETRRGVRLVSSPVPTTPGVAADADAILAVVEAAVAKHATGVSRIVAAPALLNTSLDFRLDTLGAALAELIEAELAARPGVVVVELTEARALARELAVAGGEVARGEMPLYLMGELRQEPGAPHRRVTLRLEAESGTLGEASADVAIGEEAAWVRAQASRLFEEHAGLPAAPADAVAEARRLAERGRRFQAVGAYAEAARLYEASLLLRSDPEMHWAAYRAIVSTIPPIDVTSRPPTHAAPPSPQRDEPWRASISAHERALDHLEPALTGMRFDHDVHAGPIVPGQQAMDTGRGTAEELAEYGRLHARLYEVIERSLASKAAARVQDDTAYVVHGAMIARFYATTLLRMGAAPQPTRTPDAREAATAMLLRRAEQFSYLDAVHMNQLRGPLVGGHFEWDDPTYLPFLETLAQSPNPSLSSHAQAVLGRVRAQAASRASAPAVVGPSAERREAPPEPAAAIDIRQIELVLVSPIGAKDEPLEAELLGWLPAGDGVDVAWTHRGVYLMREPGRLVGTPIGGGRNDAYLLADGQPCVTFDGTHVWVAMSGKKANRLWVMDPRTGEAWSLDEAGGLPGFSREGALVTGLRPGVACVAGHFGGIRGRTWAGVARLDRGPDATPRIVLDVFYEALRPGDVPDEERNRVDVARELHGIWPLRQRGTDGTEVLRVVIDREYPAAPLLIDPASRTVSVADMDQSLQEVLWNDGHSLYWVRNSSEPGRGREIARATLPDLRPERVLFPPQETSRAYVEASGRVHLLDDRFPPRWHVADGWESPLRPVPGVLPRELRHARLTRTGLAGLVALGADRGAWRIAPPPLPNGRDR